MEREPINLACLGWGSYGRFDNQLKIQGDIRNFGEFKFVEVCARYYVSQLDGESIKQSTN